MAGDPLQGMDLEIGGPGAVGDHVVLMHPIGKVQAVDTAREQVDRRGAERHELARADAALQALVEALEQNQHFQRLAGAALYGLLQPGKIDEQEALRQGEVLLQQAVALEGLGHHRQRRFTVIEATRAQGLFDRNTFHPIGAGLAHEHRTGAAQQLLVEAERGFVGAVEVQRQMAERQAGERHLGATAQGQAQAGAGLRHAAGQAPEYSAGVAEVLGAGYLQGPEGDVLGAAELARGLRVAPQVGAQHAVTRQAEPGGQ
ncbi:hypothetical protein D3C81_1417130 [compost metagenome]